MKYSVHCASQWPLDRLAPYMSGILEQMGRLSARFPDDTTTESLFVEFMSGKKTLWLVLGDGELVSIGLSSVRVIDATGRKMATLLDAAGRDVRLYAEQLCSALEQWADENGCEIMAVEGREGWKPLLGQFGYRPHAVLYRKSRQANG